MDSDGGESVEECLEHALEHAENDETGYWIRIALQRLVVDGTFEEEPAE